MPSPIPLETLSLSSKPVQVITGVNTIYAISLANPNSYAVYVKLYDALAANVDPATSVPSVVLTVPAATAPDRPGLLINDNVTYSFSTAISIRCTVTNQNTDVVAPATSPRFDMQLDQVTSTGGENPLTFNSPISRSTNTISLPKADATHDGYLAQSDFSAFAAGGIVLTSAGAGGTLTINPAANPPINRVALASVLTSNLNIVLPPAANYTSSIGYPALEIVDVVGAAMSTNGKDVTITRLGGDTIDGSASITLPRGATYQALYSNGSNKWASTKYFVDSFKDPTDPTKIVKPAFDPAFPTTTTRNVTFPGSADSVTVIPYTAPSGEVFKQLDSVGNLTSGRLTASDILPTEFQVGDADAIVTNTGLVDTVKLNVALTASRTYTWPDANLYSSGERMYFYNSVPPGVAQTVHIITASGNTFNGNNSIDILVDPAVGAGFVYRVFTADPILGNWTIPTFGGTSGSGLMLDSWHAVTPVSGVATVACSSGVVENHHIVSMSGAITLSMTGTSPGQCGRIKFRDSTGNHVVTVPNAVGKTPSAGGTGVFTTSTGTNIEDEYRWDFDGNNYNFSPIGLNFVNAAPPSFVTQADIGPASSSGSQQNSNATARKYLACSFTACGGTFPSCLTTGTTYTVGKADLRLFKVGSPTNQVFVAIYTDSGSDRPSALVGTASTGVAASSLATSEGTVTFTGFNTTLTAGTKYWIVYYSDIVPRVVTDGSTTASSTTVTSPSLGNFTAADVGNTITGNGIPSGTTISSVTNSTTIVISAAATATASPVSLTIGDGNANNYTRWASATNTGFTEVNKGNTGNWSSIGTNRQFLFELYK